MGTAYRPPLESLLGNSIFMFSWLLHSLSSSACYKVTAVNSKFCSGLSLNPRMGRLCFQARGITVSPHSKVSFATFPHEMPRAKTYTHADSSYCTPSSHKKWQLLLYVYGKVSPPKKNLQKPQTNLILMSRDQELDQHRERNLEPNT